MVYIDKAIARDSADPNYIDSKGEIYLMMGQRDKAAEAWNKVVKMDPAFDRSRSDLYKKLYGIPQTQLSDSSKRLNNYIDIVRAVAGQNMPVSLMLVKCLNMKSCWLSE